MAIPRRPLLECVLLAAVGLTACLALAFAFTPTELEKSFHALKIGMSRTQIRAHLGRPNGYGDEQTKDGIIRFREVDSLPINLETVHATREWWHDGKGRYVYVELLNDHILRAKLFTASSEFGIGPDPKYYPR